ncbi:FAD-binding oxidoreductase, partial [bacterium]|nr:FAD-binding oxidoreductase [candidate division CSSED10-310 bacterium]
CVAHGATISHHHGIGTLKKEWLPGELGAGIQVLGAVKRTLDPHYLLNKGVLGI